MPSPSYPSPKHDGYSVAAPFLFTFNALSAESSQFATSAAKLPVFGSGSPAFVASVMPWSRQQYDMSAHGSQYPWVPPSGTFGTVQGEPDTVASHLNASYLLKKRERARVRSSGR